MDGHNINDNADVYNSINVVELEKRAAKMAAFSLSAATSGNTIVIFTMLVLQKMIEELTLSPLANASTIAQISNSIALLNSSIKIVP